MVDDGARTARDRIGHDGCVCVWLFGMRNLKCVFENGVYENVEERACGVERERERMTT